MLGLNRKEIENIDKVLIALVAAILVMSCTAVYSASFDAQADVIRGFYEKQVVWVILGFITFLIFSWIGHNRFIKYTPIFYVIACVALIFVLLMPPIMGARRWLLLGSFRLQPSEFFKIVWVLTLARMFVTYDEKKLGFKDILSKVPLLLPPFVLVFLQPDLGTAGSFLVIWGIVILFIGIKRGPAIFAVASASVLLPVMWNFFMHDYQRQRVLTFLDPEKDPFGSGYHVIQSKIGIGSGGIWGKGFLEGTQSHLKFIPERHTDFIFSVVAEETGLIGASLVVLVFLFLIARIIVISIEARDASSKVLCVGVASYIFFQFFVNSAMTMGMMPVVGIPMPIFSYGGSSLLTFMAMLGLVNSVAMRKYNPIGQN
jgi:rod shape determining protein RodA